MPLKGRVMVSSPRTPAQELASAAALTRSALTRNRRAITQPARKAQAQKYRDKVLAALPDLTDEDEIQRRVTLLRRADMAKLAAKAAIARTRAAEARRAERELRAAIVADDPSAA